MDKTQYIKPKYDKNEEPMVVYKTTFELLLRQEHSGWLIALFMFYYYTAKWQNSNQVKATAGYVASGLHWSIERVRRTKKELEALGLIVSIKKRNSTGNIVGHYVKLRLKLKEPSKQIHNNEDVPIPRIPHVMGNPIYGETHAMGLPISGKSEYKCLSYNNIKNKKSLIENRYKKSPNQNNLQSEFYTLLGKDFESSKSFNEAITDWIEYRKTIKRPLTKQTIKRQCSIIKNLSPTDAAKMIDISIERSWTGLFPNVVTESGRSNDYGKQHNTNPKKYSGKDAIEI